MISRYHGSGMVPYEVALTAVFVEGFVCASIPLQLKKKTNRCRSSLA